MPKSKKENCDDDIKTSFYNMGMLEKNPLEIYFESIGHINFTCAVFPIFPTRSNGHFSDQVLNFGFVAFELTIC